MLPARCRPRDCSRTRRGGALLPQRPPVTWTWSPADRETSSVDVLLTAPGVNGGMTQWGHVRGPQHAWDGRDRAGPDRGSGPTRWPPRVCVCVCVHTCVHMRAFIYCGDVHITPSLPCHRPQAQQSGVLSAFTLRCSGPHHSPPELLHPPKLKQLP